MSRWVFSRWRWYPKPELWCFDLGKIKRFAPCYEHEDDKSPLEHYLGVVETEYGIFGTGRDRHPTQCRCEGYDQMRLSISFIETSKYKPIDIVVPDNVIKTEMDEYKIDPKDDFSGEVIYHGKRYEAYCCDVRWLAVSILINESYVQGIPYKKYREILERVPTRQAAKKFMEVNGYYMGPPRFRGERMRCDTLPKKELIEIVDKISDITPLLEGLEH